MSVIWTQSRKKVMWELLVEAQLMGRPGQKMSNNHIPTVHQYQKMVCNTVFFLALTDLLMCYFNSWCSCIYAGQDLASPVVHPPRSLNDGWHFVGSDSLWHIVALMPMGWFPICSYADACSSETRTPAAAPSFAIPCPHVVKLSKGDVGWCWCIFRGLTPTDL